MKQRLTDRLPPRLRARARQLSSYVATSLWIPSAVVGLGAALAAFLLVRFNPHPPWLPTLLTDADAVRAALTSIVGATIAATSLVITGTIVALQLATGQYSPRLLRGVLTDPGVRWSLAALVGTIVYTLVLVSQTNETGVLQLATGIGLLLGVGVIGLLVFFVHHIIGRLRLESILADLVERTLSAVDATHPHDHGEVPAVDVPDHAVSIPALRSGYLQAASLDALADAGATHGQHVVLRVRVGDVLTKGTTAAWVWAAATAGREDEAAIGGPDEDSGDQAEGGPPLPQDDRDDLAARIDDALALGEDRTLEGDPGYGLRHLVDIGLRGVSPGVNDPTTAEQAIHLATRVLVELASRPVTNGAVQRDGCWAVLRKPSLEAHLELAQSQLLHYGGGDPRVVGALATQLRDVLEAGTQPERVPLVRDHLQRLRADAECRDHGAHQRDLVDAALERVEDLLAGHLDDRDETAG